MTGTHCNAFLAEVGRLGATEPSRAFVVKDNIDTAGVVTTYGSRIFRDHVPDVSAEAVVRMENAGYEMLGKTNLHEFAWGATSDNPHFGPVLNPRDPSRMAGGSSGGSAAAVALGLCEVALGTDTGGSIRIPAALCGVVGFKPTYGSVPADGVFPLSRSLDHVGPIGSCVRACRDAYRALTLTDVPTSEVTADLDSIRVGVLDAFFADCSPAVGAVVRAASERFAHVVHLSAPCPEEFDNTPFFFAEAAASHRPLFPSRASEYGSDVARRLTAGNRVLARDYVACRDELEQYRLACDRVWDRVDVLLAPTVPCVAPRVGTEYVHIAGERREVGAVLTRNTRIFNNLGWPVIAVPCGEADDGLPASVSLIGQKHDDWRLLAVAEELEKSLDRPLA